MAQSLKVVSDVATAILALEAGYELKLKAVEPVLPTLRAMTLFAVVGAMFVIAGVLFLLRPLLPDIFGDIDFVQSLAVCLAIGVALSAQSPAVVMAMLSETGAEGPLSGRCSASVVVADFVVIADVLDRARDHGRGDRRRHRRRRHGAVEVVWELLGSIVFGIAIGMLVGQYLAT